MGEQVTAFEWRAPKDIGETVVFAIHTEGGAREYECSYPDLPSFILAIQEAGRRALMARSTGPFAGVSGELANIPRVRSFRVGHVADGDIAVEFVAHETGIPVRLTITRDQAVDFAKQLNAAAVAPRRPVGQ